VTLDRRPCASRAPQARRCATPPARPPA
jgi:hypothetical protein